MRALKLSATLVCFACASSATAPVGTTEDPRTAAARVVAEQYSAIERGDLAAWASHFEKNAILIGTDPSEVFVGREAILASVSKNASARMQADVKRTYKSKGQHIGVAPDAMSAWVADEIDYRVVTGEKEQAFAFRMTSLLADKNGTWKILASVYSVAVADEDAFSKPPPTPAPLPDVVATGAEPLAVVVQTMKDDPSHFAGRFSDREDVFLYGTSPIEKVIGGRLVRKFTRQDHPPGKVRMERTGGIAAGIAPSHTTGWIAYTARLSVPVGTETVTLPVRVFAVLLDESGSWMKVQEHVSLAVPD